MSGIWSEVPYVLGCAWWWCVFPLLVVAAAWVPVYFAAESSRQWPGALAFALAVLVSALMVILYIAAILAYEPDHPSNVHEWPGGAGAETVCYHETRNELVGVIGKGGHFEDHLYTVCRDPQ